jgi:hypothetical protein
MRRRVRRSCCLTVVDEKGRIIFKTLLPLDESYCGNGGVLLRWSLTPAPNGWNNQASTGVFG